jgi:phosphatidylinositol alpha-mannosyltransferase
VRVALVSPYSHGYPGGVARHVEALAEELCARGHDVRLLAPHDPDDRLAGILHRGLRPQCRETPDYLVPLGRTLAVAANGARSNLAFTLDGVARLSCALRRGRFDVVHVHEPNAPLASWCAVELARVPLVGTFHAHSTSRPINLAAANVIGARRLYNKLGVRIAVSEAARWTAERFYGGRCRVIPNGVDLAAAGRAASAFARRPAPAIARAMSTASAIGAESPLRLLYVGRAEERKGLPVLGRAFEALRNEGLDVRLTVVGPTPHVARAVLSGGEGIDLVGPVSEDAKWRLLAGADVLCAPSLRGESFGMVLTEALAAGTPVVCSDIAGYREIIRHGREGLLVPPARAGELATALRALALDETLRQRMAEAARGRAERFAWPRVAGEVVAAYEDAMALPAPDDVGRRIAERLGLRPVGGRHGRSAHGQSCPSGPSVPSAGRPRRLSSNAAPAAALAPAPVASIAPAQVAPPAASAPGHDGLTPARRSALPGACAIAAAAALGSLLVVRLEDGGLERLGDALIGAPLWPLAAAALMIASLLTRAEAWHAILCASLAPTAVLRRRDTARATMIGVLMSATLPARLGEVSRALVAARALGRVRERLPLVAGTIGAQTVLNLLALTFLGGAVLATAALPTGSHGRLALATLAPAAAIAAAVAATAVVHPRAGDTGGAGSRRPPLRAALAATGAALVRLRLGLAVFGRPARGAHAGVAQLAAWALQLLACHALLTAFGLGASVGLGGAAAILFAVNAAGVLPGLPSNIGIFQAACVVVLAAYGVAYGQGLAYGIALQALELTVAVALGVPALVREGIGWRAMRVRALRAAPVAVPAERA